MSRGIKKKGAQRVYGELIIPQAYEPRAPSKVQKHVQILMEMEEQTTSKTTKHNKHNTKRNARKRQRGKNKKTTQTPHEQANFPQVKKSAFPLGFAYVFSLAAF